MYRRPDRFFQKFVDLGYVLDMTSKNSEKSRLITVGTHRLVPIIRSLRGQLAHEIVKP